MVTVSKYGRLQILDNVPPVIRNNGEKRARYLCLCECGTTKIIDAYKLKSGHTRSCGCLQKEITKQRNREQKKIANPVRGDRFGRLILESLVTPSNYRIRRKWSCVCDCGSRKVVSESRLIHSGVVSCGCYRYEIARSGRAKGNSGHKDYKIWDGMISRCTDINSTSAAYYYFKGIRVCDRWQENFQNFLEDMGERPSMLHSLDRIDNNGDYCPENCRWATNKQQKRNTSANRLITYKDETLCMSEWAERVGLSYGVIQSRLRLGWSIDKTLSTPIQTQFSHPKRKG